MAKDRTSPTTTELTSDRGFSDYIGTQPNPDPILRNAGIADEIYLEMLSDPQIFSAFQKRKRKINMMKYRIEGEDDVAVKFIIEAIDELDIDHLITGMLRAIPLGFSVSELIWEQKKNRWLVVDIRNRINSKFVFGTDSSLIYSSESGEKTAPYGKFVLHRNDFNDDGNPYGTALNTSCYWHWRFKKHGWKVWGQFLEKFGTPPLVLQSNETDNEKVQDKANSLDCVSDGSNIVIGVDEKLTALTVGAGKVDYNEYTEKADKQISKVYLGSSIVMDESSKGSYGTAVAHGSDLDDIAFSDSIALTKSIRKYLLEPLIKFNLGSETKVPYFVMYKDAELEEENETQTDATKGTDVGEEEKEESKKQIIRDDFFLTDELTVEQFNALPKYKQGIENLTINLAVSQQTILKKHLAFKDFPTDPGVAQLSLGTLYNNIADDLSDNIAYALFYIRLYAKVTTPSYKQKFFLKLRELFSSKNYEDGIIQPFEEARELFKSKIILTNEEFRALVALAKTEAFTVAGIQATSLLKSIQDSLTLAIKDGVSEYNWAKETTKLLKKLGVSPYNKAYIANVYRTNLFGAYNRASYEEWETVEKEFPAFMYDAIGDARTRPAHLALDGKVFLADDKIWESIYPANGYNCRCGVIPMSVKKLKKIKVSKGRDYKNYKSDEGWDFHGGKGTKPPPSPTPFLQSSNLADWRDYNQPRGLSNADYSMQKYNYDVLGMPVTIQKGVKVDNALVAELSQTPTEVWYVGGTNPKTKRANGNFRYFKEVKIKNEVVAYEMVTDIYKSVLEMKKAENKDRVGVLLHSSNKKEY